MRIRIQTGCGIFHGNHFKPGSSGRSRSRFDPVVSRDFAKCKRLDAALPQLLFVGGARERVPVLFRSDRITGLDTPFRNESEAMGGGAGAFGSRKDLSTGKASMSFKSTQTNITFAPLPRMPVAKAADLFTTSIAGYGAVDIPAMTC